MQKDKLQVVLAMVLFGTIGVFVRYIPLPSGVVAMARGFIGTLFLLGYTKVRGIKLSGAAIQKNLPVLCLSGAAIGFNWILLFEAYRYTTVATATLCYYLAPVFVILASPLVLKERLTLKKGLCALVAMGGMVLVSGILNDAGNSMQGVLMGIGAAALYATVILLNKFLKDISAYERTAVQLFVAAAVLVPYVLLTETVDFAAVPPTAWVLLAVVGILHTGIAYAMYFGGIGALPAQTSAILSYVDPVLAVLLSALLLQEPLGWTGAVGAVLVLGATLLSELHWKKK